MGLIEEVWKEGMWWLDWYLSYTLHVFQVIDAIGIKEIVEHTTKDPVLTELRQNGLIWKLRSHFFMKNLEKNFDNSCSYCQMFTNKVYGHPVKPS